MNTEMLVTLAETYAKHRQLKLSTVSTYAAVDGKFFGELKKGSGCTLRRANRIVTWFHKNWPDDLVWPTDVPRPDPDTKKRRVA